MMAIKSLEEAAFNEQLFTPEDPVKISRIEVRNIVRYTYLNACSNMRMKHWYHNVCKNLEMKCDGRLQLVLEEV